MKIGLLSRENFAFACVIAAALGIVTGLVTKTIQSEYEYEHIKYLKSIEAIVQDTNNDGSQEVIIQDGSGKQYTLFKAEDGKYHTIEGIRSQLQSKYNTQVESDLAKYK